ncbi:MAG: PD-(D/E)XK nuclease domain-containing protein, partial [Candidatus Cloacimonetes bacterium]|nr:PD-(D/E)XK nuclease domain-containing protein [Candidatus Cloacimonadota bacterium]
LGRSGVDAKKDLEDLMAGLSITVPLQEQVVFQEIENTPTNLWNFLYFTGYLKAIKIEVPPAVPKALVHLKVPNSEVAQIFDDSVQYWFASSKSLSLLQNLRTCLRDGDEDEFEEIFRELVSDSFSYFDVDGKKPEKFYHGFVLGLIVSFSDTWHIRSNRESGMGRCDILMIPKDPKNFGVVIELKTHRSRKESDLIETAKRALEQIEERQYELELRSQGATKIMKIGIGFMGKQLEVLSTIKV